ncbi:hypothetical protein DID77_02080 [Candidatus Marinamargulisbacteria bacterium SCGC AG-439-L15]|nr:hypothetical protein DID77_02080 [Candidatus Marinamargulisbacteria bacterium SCGC AG-439-L15]
MINTIFFDFDGVILDSVTAKTKAFRELFKTHPPQKVQNLIDYHQNHLGISRFVKFKYFYETILKENYTDTIEKGLGEKFSKLVEIKLKKASLIPGAKKFLENNASNYTCFIISGAEKNEIIESLTKHQLLNYFKEIHGGNKTKVDHLKGLLVRYHLTPQNCVFIGDAITDQKAAEAFDMSFIGVDFLKQNQLDCKLMIYDLKKLKETIKSLKE